MNKRVSVVHPCEVWKVHPKHNEYLISQYGRVARISKVVMRSSFLAKKGGNRESVPRVVWELFISDNVPDRIYHKDGNPFNNAIMNLTHDKSLCSFTRLKREDALVIRKLLADGVEPMVIAKRFGITSQKVSDIKLHKKWRDS